MGKLDMLLLSCPCVVWSGRIALLGDASHFRYRRTPIDYFSVATLALVRAFRVVAMASGS